jgi:SAM-dependent methyltransferase
VGAGTGIYKEYFSHCVYKAHDFAQEPSTIGKYVHLDYISDILQIPAPDRSFDAIVCTEVLEHIPEPIQAVREFARLLRPGGTLLLSAPLGSRLHQEPFHYYGGYTPHWYHHFLPQNGFQITSVQRNHGSFSLLAQETAYHRVLLSTRPASGITFLPRAVAYLVLLPYSVLLLLLGRYLDGFGLDQTTTVGYHVVARRISREG